MRFERPCNKLQAIHCPRVIRTLKLVEFSINECLDSTLIKVKNLLRIIETGSPSFATNLEGRADFIDSYKKTQCTSFLWGDILVFNTMSY